MIRKIINELLEQIDKIQVEYYFASRSDTIRFLAVCGIKNLDLANKLLNKESEKRKDKII